MKVAVVFFSGTGNTEAMAEAIQNELSGKADVTVIDPAVFSAADVASCDAIAFGCSAQGAEELESETYEPMFASIEGSLSGKKIILFGSYGWGDGEWMRNWEDRCKAAGAVLAADPVICVEAPDNAALADLQAAADALIG